LRAEYQQFNVLFGIALNLILVYVVLKASHQIEKFLGEAGADVLRKVFGVVLLAIAIKLFKANLPI
jgi:multiple antibiotic resistance protein